MSDNRGGARQGAGRKPLGNVAVCFRISKKARERLRQLAEEKDISISGMLEIMIMSYKY